MAILVAYDSLRGSAGRLFAVHFLPQIEIDRWVFGGQIPTVTLQRWLWHGHVVWWDVIPWFVYLTQVGGTFFERGEPYANNVAVVPSLHSAFSLLIAITVWPHAPRWLRPLVAIYPLLMAFAVIYTGEHYFFDVGLGWAYTGGTLVGFRVAAKMRAQRRAPTSALVHSPLTGTLPRG